MTEKRYLVLHTSLVIIHCHHGLKGFLLNLLIVFGNSISSGFLNLTSDSFAEKRKQPMLIHGQRLLKAYDRRNSKLPPFGRTPRWWCVIWRRQKGIHFLCWEDWHMKGTFHRQCVLCEWVEVQPS